MNQTPHTIDYANNAEPESHEVQGFDRTAAWVIAILALVMSTPFVIAIPLCIYALYREADILVTVILLTAIGMAVGLVGTGVGMLRKARRNSRTR